MSTERHRAESDCWGCKNHGGTCGKKHSVTVTEYHTSNFVTIRLNDDPDREITMEDGEFRALAAIAGRIYPPKGAPNA